MTDGWMKADVWSLGCTAVEMITGKVPYSEFENPMTAMYRIANGDIPKVHLQNEEMIEVTDIVAFVNLCCIVNAEERPSLGALKLHPILCTALQGVPTRLFDNPDLVDLSRFKTGGVVPTVTSKILNGDEAQISHVPTNRNAPEALMLPQDIQASSDSLESFPTPALYARKRIINFSSNCDSTDGLSLPKPTNTTNNTSITPTASSVFSPLPLSSQPATKQRYNNNNNSTTASTTNRVSASRESTAPSFSYVNIQPSEIGLELIQKSKFSQNIETNNELKPSNSNVSISFDEASVIYNQFMEKYQHNTGLNFPPPGAGAAHQPHSNYGSNSKTHEHRDYFVESREDDADVEQIYEDDFLCADPTEDEEEVKIMADHGDEDQQVVSRPNAPLTGEMLQLQLNSTGGKDKPKVSISGIRQVAKKELEELETNNNEMNRMKAKGKILPKLHKLQQPRIQNHQVAKRVKSNQKNNNLNDSLKGVRSFSAGTYLNNSGNQNLNESLKGRGKIETKHEASTSLPPLRPLLVLLEDASSNGHHLAPRYIQSAPAVSRSVNLPPITQHLTSATPNSKKLKSKMAKNG